MPELPEGYEYNSVPATSGLHNSQTAIWNLYDQPVPQINYVHNLEHGGLVIQYGSEVPEAEVAALADWYQQDTRGVIIAPLSEEMEEEDAALADKIVANFLDAHDAVHDVRRVGFRRVQRRLPRAAGRRAREVRARPVTTGRRLARAPAPGHVRRGGGTVDAGGLKPSARKGV